MDYDDMAMFHCHIIEYGDIGMMGVWDIMGMPMQERSSYSPWLILPKWHNKEEAEGNGKVI
jgi:hypothetical protein